MVQPAIISAALLRTLLAGCRRADAGSQRQLYTRYYSFALGICRRYAHTRDEALEVVNDGFLKIFSDLKPFDDTRPEVVALFGGWLRRIMVYTAIDRYRAEARHQQQDLSEALDTPSGGTTVLDALAYEELLAMLQRLPPAYRSAFNLYALDGFTHEEIALRLRISVGTSKSNLFKARARLKKILSLHNHHAYAGNP